MAEPRPDHAPRVLRIPVARPLLTALSVAAFGGALLLGGGGTAAPAGSAPPTLPPAGPDAAVAATGPVDWDVTPRDLVVGDRTGPASLEQVVAGPSRLATLAAALHPGSTAVPPSSGTGAAVGATSVPLVLWSAYRSAVSSAPTSCHLPVELLAAIGQVESGSLAGRSLDRLHRAVPAVLGPVLDGGSFAAIFDTDDGRYDGNTVWDRAVGPMQFIPSTWQRWGRDGNADGTRDPQNVEDSASSAAAYLCAGGRDLATTAGLRSAILSYNHSEAYLSDVLRLMRTVTPGGAVARSVVTVPPAPGPVVGPPSHPPTRPPVVAAAAPPAPSRTSRPPTRPPVTSTATTTTSTATTTTTSPPTEVTTTATGTSTGTTPPTPSSTTSLPSPSTTTPPATGTTTSPVGTTTSLTPAPTTTTSPTTSPSTCPSGSSPSSTGVVGTGSGSGTAAPPSSTSVATGAAPPTGSVDPGGTTTTSPTTDPCATPSTSSAASPTSVPVEATTTSIEGPSGG